MKKFITVLFVYLLLNIVGLYFVLPMTSPFIHKQIEKYVNQSDFVNIKMDYFRIKSPLPFRLKIHNLTLKLSQLPMALTLSDLDVKLSLKDWPWSKPLPLKLVVNIKEPKSSINLLNLIPQQQESSADQQAPKKIQKNVMLNKDIALDFEINIQRGNFEVQPHGKVSQLDLSLKSTNALDINTPISVKLNALVQPQQLGNLKIPLSIHAESFVPNPSNLKSEAVSISVAGLNLIASGVSNIEEQSHNWLAYVNIPDLAQLKVPPRFLPYGRWAGGLGANLKFVQQQGHSFQLEGALKTQKLRGNVLVQDAQISAKGPVYADINLQFSYAKALKISLAQVQLNLTKTQIFVKDLLNKASGVPLMLKADAKGDQRLLKINSAQLNMGPVAMAASGYLGMSQGQSSRIKFEVQESKLASLEKLILPLATSPVRGQLKVNGSVMGDLQKPKSLNIRLNPFYLKNFQASVNYKDTETGNLINGPITANLSGNIEIEKLFPKTANVSGELDLSKLQINIPNTVVKNRGESLNLDLKVRQAGQLINIQKLHVLTSGLNTTISGKVYANASNLKVPPRLDVTTKIKKLNLDQIKKLLPGANNLDFSASMDGQIQLKGPWLTDGGIEKSPLKASGNINISIPSYKLANAETSSPKMGGEALQEEAKPQPLLPNWPIVKNSNVQYRFNLGRLQKQRLVLHKISTQGRFQKGNVEGSLSIGNIFGGQLNVSKYLATGLTSSKPSFDVIAQPKGLILQKAIAWSMPEYKDHIKGGSIHGQVSVKSPMPHGDWMPQIQSSGQLSIREAIMNSTAIDNLINKKLSKIPGNKIKPIKSQSLNTTTKLVYNLKRGVAQIKELDFQTTDKNQFLAKGSVTTKLSADLKGSLHLSKVGIGGSVRQANSDSQGRFVVPVSLKGSLLNPSFDVAKSTLSQIAKNTLQHEKQKQKSKIKNKLRKKGKEILKKNLKSLFK